MPPFSPIMGRGGLWTEPKDMLKAGDGYGDGYGDGNGNGRGDGSSGRKCAIKEDPADYDIFKDWRAGYRFSVDPRCSPADLVRWLKMEQADAVQLGKETIFFRTVKKAIMASLAAEGCRGVMFHLRANELMVDFEGHGWLPFRMLSDGQRNMGRHDWRHRL